MCRERPGIFFEIKFVIIKVINNFVIQQVIKIMKKQKMKIDLNVYGVAMDKDSNFSKQVVRGVIQDDDRYIELPEVSYQHVGQRGIEDYAERKRVKVVDGYSIKVADNVLYNVFILADGSHQFENLHADLLTLAGNVTQQASYLRGAVQSAQGHAHTVTNIAETYLHFYGDLTKDQRDWMKENRPSFEQAIEAAKQRAKTVNTDENGK